MEAILAPVWERVFFVARSVSPGQSKPLPLMQIMHLGRLPIERILDTVVVNWWRRFPAVCAVVLHNEAHDPPILLFANRKTILFSVQLWSRSASLTGANWVGSTSEAFRESQNRGLLPLTEHSTAQSV